MNGIVRVTRPPAKPLLVFDGDCYFCGLWIKRWRQDTGDKVDYLPFQDASVQERFPEIPRAQFERAVQLIETDGTVFGGAEAALRTRAKNPGRTWLWRLYQSSLAFAAVANWCYQFVASHRPTFSWLTRMGWGAHTERPEHNLVRDVFVRGLGVIYLIAFLSLGSQIIGLIGHNGILPTEQYISAAEKYFDGRNIGADRYRMLPTFCWWNASDGALKFQCAAGVVLAVLLMTGIAPALCLFLLWLIYLSLATVCREFLGFQWDVLLLQTGFLAIFFAPFRIWPFGKTKAGAPSRAVLWMFRWLAFQLMFESGLVKLTSGDATWRNFTALTYHCETQPLPTWIGWYTHHLPVWFHQASCIVMFIIELAVPFLFFAPRRLRIWGAIATVALQVIILLTGNYTFFNVLTLLLCVPLLDDFAMRSLIPSRMRSRCVAREAQHQRSSRPWPKWIIAPLTAFVLCLTVTQFLVTCGARWKILEPFFSVHSYVSSFRSFNSYGLFRVMTTTRPEIIVEGSNDGVTWQAYEFKWKAGDVKQRPRFVAPHQPRLDWQMWFAALGDLRSNPWFANMCVRLLQGSPEVQGLLERNPFPEKPPRFIRAVRYDYKFTTASERRATGAWWKRTEQDLYLPAISLENVQR